MKLKKLRNADPANSVERMRRTEIELNNLSALKSTVETIQSASTDAIKVHSNTVSEDVTIAEDQNAYSAGPLTIEDGVSVTVEDGARWVIL